MYSAYQLDSKQRENLLKQIPPRYPKVVADHITVCFGGGHLTLPKENQKTEIIGMVDDNNGLQALVVQVDGSLIRQDGSIYHITWSLDPNKKVSPEIDPTAEQTYKPVHSNVLVKNLISPNGMPKSDANPDWSFIPFEKPIGINTTPVLRYTCAELNKRALGKSL
jgi:hypothetical protein